MNDSNESVPPPPPPPPTPALTPSPSIVESNSTNSQAPVTERKKRATTEKQLAALKAGREKRWKLMFEALEKERNERVNAEVSSEVAKAVPPSDSLLEVDSSEESESEDDFVFGKSVQNTPTVSTQRQRKYKLSKVVRNRIDEYVERKLYESMYTQPQLDHLNKNTYDEQQHQSHHQSYDYTAAYPSRSSYQFC